MGVVVVGDEEVLSLTGLGDNGIYCLDLGLIMNLG